MGRTRTVVGTSHTRVIPDKMLPNSMKTAVMKTLSNNSDDLVGHLIGEMSESIAIKGEAFYKYASEDYHWGMPSASIQAAPFGDDIVLYVMKNHENDSGLTISYYVYGAPNLLHIGWMSIVSSYGYNTATNELPTLSAIKGVPVYLKDMRVTVPADRVSEYLPGILAQWGSPATAGYTPERTVTGVLGSMRKHSPVITIEGATDEYVRVFYTWKPDGSETCLTESVDLPVDGYPEEDNYFHIKYVTNGVTKYFMYKHGHGSILELDALNMPDHVPGGTYFPFIYFRYNKASEVDENTNKLAEPYLSSAKLLKYLNMDYDQVCAQINENPDSADVEQAMLMWAIPALSDNELDQEYLYKYFERLYTDSPIKYNSIMEHVLDKKGPNGEFFFEEQKIVIQDARFKMALGYNGIYKRNVVGSIGDVNTYTATLEMVDVPAHQYYIGESGEYTTVYTRSAPVHYYRKQITPGIYTEYSVLDLTTKFYVWSYYDVLNDDIDDILLIPLDYSIVSDYHFPARETLYSRSLRFVFNSRVTTKVKWYETELFQALLFIGSIVVMAFYPPAAFGMLEGVMVAMQAGATAAALIYLEMIIMELIMATVVMTGLKWVVKQVGINVAVFVAIVMMAYHAGAKFMTSGISSMPFAQDALAFANGLIKAANDYVKDLFKELQNEWTGFLEWKKEKEDELTEAARLLDSRSWLEPFLFVGETPTNFYNRTIHSGNVGAIAIEQSVASYVDNALTLPTTERTLGEGI